MQLPTRCRLGLIADTHLPGAAVPLFAGLVASAFARVDLIVHAGDLHTADVLDDLERLAPVVAARGNGDDGVQHPTLRDAWLLETPRLAIGVVHEFPSPRHAGPDKLDKHRSRHFGSTDPKLIVYGHTHHDELHHVDGRLYVNPGSPTLPRNQTMRLGTLAVAEIDGSRIDVTLLALSEHGTQAGSHITNHA